MPSVVMFGAGKVAVAVDLHWASSIKTPLVEGGWKSVLGLFPLGLIDSQAGGGQRGRSADATKIYDGWAMDCHS